MEIGTPLLSTHCIFCYITTRYWGAFNIGCCPNIEFGAAIAGAVYTVLPPMA